MASPASREASEEASITKQMTLGGRTKCISTFRIVRHEKLKRYTFSAALLQVQELFVFMRNPSKCSTNISRLHCK